MKWLCLVVLSVSVVLSGCVKPQYDVVIPPASSKELGVRSSQYSRTVASHAFDETQDNQYNSAASKFVAQTYSAPSVKSLPPDVGSGRRMALVIGNSNYTHGGSLSNPTNDAESLTGTLQSLGFEVKKYKDLSQSGMKKAIDDFGKSIKGTDVSLFFYAGHGVQVNGNNYLIPIDADINSERDVEYTCVHAGRILAKMESAGCKTNIIILDACRDNPFKRSWSRSVSGNSGGLAFMDAPSGSMIAYSTSPGKTAADGVAGTNGVYSAALIKHMQTPNISIEDMFKRVRVTVENMTHKQQTPWESTSLKGNFYFKIKK